MSASTGEARRTAVRQVHAGNLQARQRLGQVRRTGAEGVGGLVPRDRSAAELLRDHVAGHTLVAHRGTQFAGGTLELVPGDLHGAAHDERAISGAEEDHRFVVGGELVELAARNRAVRGASDRESQVTAGRSAQRLIGREHIALDRARAGGRAEIDLAAGEGLHYPVGADRLFGVLLGTQRPLGAACRAPHLVDSRHRIKLYLQVRELLGQLRGLRGERFVGPVEGQLTLAELLSDHRTVVIFVLDRHAQRPRGATQLVPRGIDGTPHHMRTVLGGPVDQRLVGSGEGDQPTIGHQSRDLIAVRESQTAGRRATQRVVLVEDRPVERLSAGFRGIEDRPPGEVLGKSDSGRMRITLGGTQMRVVAASGLPGCGDGVLGVAVWRRRRGL